MRGVAAAGVAVVVLAANASAGGGESLLVVERYLDQLELYSMRPDGSHARRLTQNGAADYHPSWSSDGDQIVSVSYDSRGLLAVRRASGKLVREIRTAGDPSWPEFSPNGRWIVFYVARCLDPMGKLEPACHDLWLSRADGTGQRRLIEQSASAWSWSPDSSGIVHAGKDGLTVIEVATKKRRLLRATAGAWSAHWAPDGARIAYTRGFTTYTVAPKGGVPKVLGDGAFAGWSPDGRRVAFITPVDGGWRAVVVARADGSHRVRVARTRQVIRLVWSPEGSRLAWSDGNYGLHMARADGRGGAQRIGVNLGENPDWR